MSKLRKLARGQDCQIRLEGICNHNPETVVLAHLRMSGITGTGMKANDLLGSWACSECHRATESNPEMRIYFFEGMARTIDKLVKMGAI